MQLLGASNNKATCHSSCGIKARTRATAAVAARSRQCTIVAASVQAQRAQHQQQQRTRLAPCVSTQQARQHQHHQQRSSPPSRKPTTPRAMAETAADAAAGAGAAATTSRRSDPSCQANVDEIVEVSRHYELDVDFDRRVVEGYARVRRRGGCCCEMGCVVLFGVGVGGALHDPNTPLTPLPPKQPKPKKKTRSPPRRAPTASPALSSTRAASRWRAPSSYCRRRRPRARR
jgi:hypothetical protein